MPSDSRRHLLVLSLLREWAGTAAAPHAWTADEAAAVWPLLQAHGVEALLGASLPPDLLEPAMRGAVAASRERTALLLMELERLLPVVRAAGCDPLVLKGAGLALAVYPDPLSRWFVDLDLLVAPDEVEGVCEALIGHGYKPFRSRADWEYYDAHHLHRILVGPARSVVEVHWALTLPISAYHHDAAGVRGRGRPAAAGAQACRVAAPADQLIHSAYQHIADGFVDLRRAADYVMLVRTMTPADWDQAYRLAREGGVTRPLSFVLHVMKFMTGVAAPDGLAPAQPLGPLAWRFLDNLDVPGGLIDRRARHRQDYDQILHLILLPTLALRMRDTARLLAGHGAYPAAAHGHGPLGQAPRRLR
ncbi:MAG TPA: nucleotidyltransferase family protein, partial [Candidatus Krumholzibacteria bacterium]|nr:nucleotidyltransferase family protein [Candidatus Krumholzibacteria bacterium]